MQNNIFEKNQIYNRQLAMLILCTAIVAKVTSLPRYISNNIKDMVFLVELILCIVEILTFVVIYLFIKMDGLKILKEKSPVTLKFLLFILLLALIIKMFTAFSSTTIFIISTMFRSVPPYIVIVSLVLPVVYIAFKGLVSLTRSAEVLFWIIYAITIFNLVFYHANMDIMLLLPLLRDDLSVLASGTMSVGAWLGDLSPFLLISLKKRKFPYLAVGVPINYILIMVLVVLGVATFGNAIFIVENVFSYIPIFNEFSLTLGELQWLGLIPWFFMMLLHLSVLQWAIFEIGELLFKKRNAFIIIYSLAFLIALLSFPTLQQTFALATMPYASIICWIGFVLVPFALLLLAIISKRKKNADDESSAESDEQTNDDNGQAPEQENKLADSNNNQNNEQNQPQQPVQDQQQSENTQKNKAPTEQKPQEQNQPAQDTQQSDNTQQNKTQTGQKPQEQNQPMQDQQQSKNNQENKAQSSQDGERQSKASTTDTNKFNNSEVIITPPPVNFKNSLLETKQEGENS